MAQEDMSNRVACVTGASSGIGRATAMALAQRGARVALVARRADRIEQVSAELGKFGADAVACAADIRDGSQMEAVAEKVKSRLGRTDLLVNSAGVMFNAEFIHAQRVHWESMISTNLFGPMECTAAFLPQLLDGGGDIVNVSSVAGRKARPTTSLYNATKWGLNGWSESLRQELVEKDVRVILVSPGAVKDTELLDDIPDTDIRERTRRHFDEIDALTPEDVAECITYAVSLDRRVSISEILIRPTRQQY